SAAATGHGGFPLRFLWAVVPFGVSLTLALAIVNPWRGWEFGLNVKAFQSLVDMPTSEALNSLSFFQAESAERNQAKLDRLSFLFVASSVALLWSIIAWIVVIE